MFTSGRRMRVAVSPAVESEGLQSGQSVRLNEALTVVEAGEFERIGEVCGLREVLSDPTTDGLAGRALVVGHADEERVVLARRDPLNDHPDFARSSRATRCWSTPRRATPTSGCPRPRSRTSCWRRCRTSSTSDIGGLFRQIEQIRDAVELPFLHADLFREYELRPPKGVLLYGPPGCGKTLIAKAVANSLAKKVAAARGDDPNEAKSYFLNIKGPELLNKFVGETERHIRLIFQRAREKASEGTPVIVFFDEMDSIFRTRGSGVSSDVETTIVPQLLARDRRRRGPGERHRHRRLQPRGHDRPRDPAARPAGREDQDRAAGRRGGEGHLLQVPDRQPADPRRRPRRVRRATRACSTG